MKRHIFVVISLLLCLCARGQESDLPQVFSPNAAELGKYGKIPVSYFNGLPNISIPLTELHARNYTLPVYLTYHAGGNKPEQHPGWVGLGWTLHAGGCINRVVHETKDEMDANEYYQAYRRFSSIHPGYMYNVDAFYPLDYSSQLEDLPKGGVIDLSPDEFQINIDDIQASFYFVGSDQIRIVSKSDADFTVEYDICYTGNPHPSISQYGDDFKMYLYSYFREFIITGKDGTKYYFGGDDNAIEFSAQKCYPSESDADPYVPGRYYAVATANTWMLTKIVRPDGEELHFSYERHGSPAVLVDSHYKEYLKVDGNNVLRDVDTRIEGRPEHAELYNRSYYFLIPSYLSSIHCKYAPDSLSFLCEETQELSYGITESEFLRTEHAYPLLLGITQQNHYMQLSRLETPCGTFRFDYTEDLNTRLKLKSLSLYDGESRVYGYKMEYDPMPLPAYNSRKTDLWGYYLGPVSYNPLSPALEQERSQVLLPYQRAEVLTRLTYPTGGYTDFEYERNEYGLLATQFPFSLQAEHGYAGGLRIKRMKDVSNVSPPVERVFEYLSESAGSSGILSGRPRLFAQGNYAETFTSFWGIQQTRHAQFEYFSERTFNQLSTTDGRHVTYSRVVERIPGSGRTVYEYSNHGSPLCMDRSPFIIESNIDDKLIDNPFNSMELSRGHLTRRVCFNEAGEIVSSETYSYHKDTTQFVKDRAGNYLAEGFLARDEIVKIFTYFPYLQAKTVTTYPDGGGNARAETEEYEYDAHRQLVRTVRMGSGMSEEVRQSYSGGMDSAGVYGAMRSCHVLDRPVERVVIRNGKVVEATLTTWKHVSGSLFVPEAQYRASLGVGVDTSLFTFFRGGGKDVCYGTVPELSYVLYDAHGNPLCVEDRTGLRTTFRWDGAGFRQTGVYRGAWDGEHETLSTVPVTRRDTSEYANVRSLTERFTSAVPGPFSFTFRGDGDFTLHAVLDGDTLSSVKFLQPEGSDPVSDFFYLRPASSPLPAGEHVLTLTCTGVRPVLVDTMIIRAGLHSPAEPASPAGLLLPPGALRFSGTLAVNYQVLGRMPVTVEASDVLQEDFEEDGTPGSGYCSGRGRTSPYVASLSGVPGRRYVVDWRKRTGGRWTYMREEVCPPDGTVSVTVPASPSSPVDGVRIFPADAAVETYTWWPDGSLRSRTDGRGITVSYRYDGLGRLLRVEDNGGDPVAGYQYHYITEQGE